MKKDHILVIRFSALGDVAMTVPVVYALAKTYPDLRITVLSRGFAKAFYDEIATDDEKLESVGFHMARAILHNSIEEFLVAIVGWTSKSLLDIAEKGSTVPQEVKSDE